MSAIRIRFILWSFLALGVAAWAARAATVVAVAGEHIVPPSRLAERVTVRDVRTHDDEVSGVVVNTSDHPIRDVQLLISYQWLWDDEVHPGEGGPGRAVFYTLPQDIAAGGQAQFTYRPEVPLSERSGGRYMTTVSIAGFTEITPTTSGLSER